MCFGMNPKLVFVLISVIYVSLINTNIELYKMSLGETFTGFIDLHTI